MKNKTAQIKVAIIGAHGKMGMLATTVAESMPECRVAAKVVRGDDLDEVLKSTRPDIAIELTSHESVLLNAQTIIRNGVYPIIGASGLKSTAIDKLALMCAENKQGGIIAPNFSLGMALITKLAKDLKHYYNEFSIIEYHHAHKKDRPSGTARYTADILGIKEQDICSIRSDGFVAKQQLYVSAADERIIIDHESFDRKSFASGIALSINKVMQLDSLVVGLENLL